MASALTASELGTNIVKLLDNDHQPGQLQSLRPHHLVCPNEVRQAEPHHRRRREPLRGLSPRDKISPTHEIQ